MRACWHMAGLVVGMMMSSRKIRQAMRMAAKEKPVFFKDSIWQTTMGGGAAKA